MGISNVVESALGKSTIKTVKINVINPIGAYLIEGKEFDCVVDVKTEIRNTITSNPVEFGVNVTDNIVPQQRVYSLNGMLTPYFGFDVTGSGSSAVSFGLPSEVSQNNTQVWYERLVQLSTLELGGLITLTVYPKSFPNLVVESLQFDDSYRVGEGLSYRMVLKEVQIAETSLSVSNVKATSDPLNSNVVDNGFGTIRSTILSSLFG